jgi:hypothetical protein
LDCVGDRKEVWVAFYTLIQQGVKGKAISYFEQNILPQIKNEILSFQKDVNSVQKVPFSLPKYLEEAVLSSL